MSVKQELEEIKQRAQRECSNLRISMEGRGCPEEEIQKRCNEVLLRAEERASGLMERTRIKN